MNCEWNAEFTQTEAMNKGKCETCKEFQECFKLSEKQMDKLTLLVLDRLDTTRTNEQLRQETLKIIKEVRKSK